MTEFDAKVYTVTRQIPAGKVATYGQIAGAIGCPGGARAVGNSLHRNPDPATPCFRVVSAQGRLSKAFGFGGILRQKELLEEDGTEVCNFRVDLEVFQCTGLCLPDEEGNAAPV